MTIVYQSETGFTEEYAKDFAEKSALPCLSLAEAQKSLSPKEEIFFFSWIMAGKLVDFDKAKKKFSPVAVCGVGVRPDVENVQNAIAKAVALPTEQVFYLQGGFAPTKLSGVKKFAVLKVLKIVSKKIEKQENMSAEEETFLKVVTEGGSFVDKTKIAPLLHFLESRK